MSRSSRSALIDAWVRPEVRALSAYHVPPPADVIKLDAMENPWPWPGELVEAWQAALSEVPLNRYPDAGAGELKARLRAAMGIPEGAALMLGNGSDELILLINLLVAGPGRVVLTPGPGFAMYRIIAVNSGLGYREVPLAEDFELDETAMRAALREVQPAVVYIAYPNNPTGNAFNRDALARVIHEAPGLVVVDEAYYAFANDSFLPDVLAYPNLLVMRTVSKVGLAGLRLGLVAGHPDWLEELEKLRLPYNISALTQASANFALDHREQLERSVAAIVAERGRLAEGLAAIPGVERVWPSEANFLTFRGPAGAAGRVHSGLREHGVLIKNLDGSHPQLADCLRVTVGRPEENARFLAALGQVLSG
ncbi:histidinol-phosphate transaminase [Alkalilimnicola ehrlichii MLHE-1]|uniref:Histidinol-phosphate aminotransferase n=1 Tax=Alkalilimnicola ehrlichii (strain ATCC BAA-1101 / DSM 17681 / MLHE-1) TaxID=187272 RepID=Q0A6I1_ALKEH|nr:histidinol-phosphate transaminase [Alkalilimnicola ehrlichii]ABI57556.1 histidinol phosphate aminotransferase apoenzyme [Alkalilimnicola ehrlichii MLHE-1]